MVDLPDPRTAWSKEAKYRGSVNRRHAPAGARSGAHPARQEDRAKGRTALVMEERNLARELSLLATEVDSLAKAGVLAQAEVARERRLREQAESQAEELRQQLRHARRRAKTAERELAKLAAGVEATAHEAEAQKRDLQARLAQAQQAIDVLRHEVEQTEGERRALEQNLREVLGNLRHAAQEAQQARVVARSKAEDATFVPTPEPHNGW